MVKTDTETLPTMKEKSEHDSKVFGDKDKASEDAPQAIFNIYNFDDVLGTAKMEKFLTLGINKVSDKKLSEIRKLLSGENGLTFRQKGSSFCNKTGAVANDSLSFAEYLKSLGREPADGKKGDDPADSKKSDDPADSKKDDEKDHKAQVVAGESESQEVFEIYFKCRRLPTEMDGTTKEFLQEKLKLELRNAELISASEPGKLTSSYEHSNYMAQVGMGENLHPADMTPKHWNIVVQNNALLHGSRVVERADKLTIERAIYPVFDLKPRPFKNYDVELEGTDIPPPEQMLTVPRYRVEDDSYVEVSEKKSSVASAIARSSLSETAAEVAVGGGAFGFSAAAKAGYSSNDSNQNANNKTAEENRMTITYNFPRVVIQLDEDSLQLSNECMKHLEHVKDADSLKEFKDRFGHFIATYVELGGRLHSSENSATMTQASVSEKAHAMKAAASASFSSSYAQGSASASHGSSDASKEQKSSGTLTNSITWEAKGGDTLLCNNPPAWCGTVASFYNWRVVKQDNLVAIEDIISKIDGHKGVKAQFENISKNMPAPPKAVQDKLNICFYNKDLGKYITVTDLGPNLLDMEETINSSGPNPQVFEIRGHMGSVKNPTGNEQQKMIQNGGVYSLYNDLKNGLICGVSASDAYSLIATANPPSEMVYFKVKSTNPFNSSACLGQDDEVFLELCNNKGDSVGSLLYSTSRVFTNDGETKRITDIWEFSARQTMDPTRFLLRYQ